MQNKWRFNGTSPVDGAQCIRCAKLSGDWRDYVPGGRRGGDVYIISTIHSKMGTSIVYTCFESTYCNVAIRIMPFVVYLFHEKEEDDPPCQKLLRRAHFHVSTGSFLVRRYQRCMLPTLNCQLDCASCRYVQVGSSPPDNR